MKNDRKKIKRKRKRGQRMNSVTLLGRMTRDPELRYLQSGSATVRFNLAVDRGLSKEKKHEAERKGQATADFINCVAWGKLAETIDRYFRKGSRIGVTGTIQTGSYERQDGSKVYTTDVLVRNIDFIDYSNADTQQGQGGQDAGAFEEIENTDDIPF